MKPKSIIRIVFAGLADMLERLAELLVEKPFTIRGKGAEEFVKEIIRKMRAEEVILPEDKYVPDKYTMYLCTQAFERYGGSLRRRLAEQLASELTKEVERNGYKTQQPIQVILVDGKHNDIRSVEIECEISESAHLEIPEEEQEGEEVSLQEAEEKTPAEELSPESEEAIPSEEGIVAESVIARLRTEGDVYEITQPMTKIGRLKTNQIVIRKPTVSREHAEIIHEAGKFTLKDLGSINGTFRNGERIDETEIVNGDLFSLDKAGKVSFRFEVVEPYEVIDSQNPREHFERGLALQREKRLDSAVQEYLEAIRLGSPSARPHFNLGIISFAKGDTAKAIEHFKDGLELEPDNAQAHADLGKLYGLNGAFDLAIAELERTLQLNPENESAQRRLARFKEQRQIHKSALEEAQERAVLEPDELKRDLMYAATVQRHLLPELPQLPGLDIAAHNLPALEVTGDYYDFIPIDEQKFGIAIADISGKGMAAALLMSGLRAHLRAIVKRGLPVAKVMSQVNDMVYSDTTPEKFITLIYGVLDVSNLTFSYCNAGHNYPILYRDQSKRLEILEAGGTIAGMFPGAPYETESISLSGGDVLLLYTDGITEAENAAEEPFGVERLEQFVRENLSLNAQQLIQSIYSKVKSFCGGNLHDDATLLVIKANS